MKVILALTILMIAFTVVTSLGKNPVCKRKRSCVCPKNLSPVCGVNGCTYGNPCWLKCARVKMLHKGYCGDPYNDDDDYE